ncbi:hypothetical protein CGMCC3_g6401 [Colletotrichum fructicola]|nr:uncharacterized protein CGMCC3_g6401 [Colletotrichum fructicola]KAE9577390.1 hypothetical protein CGMCC3_g6401 [Colletotrichum fructicola]
MVVAPPTRVRKLGLAWPDPHVLYVYVAKEQRRMYRSQLLQFHVVDRCGAMAVFSRDWTRLPGNGREMAGTGQPNG